MTPNTGFFSVSPIGAPFSIDGCPFESYTGRYFTDLQGVGIGAADGDSISPSAADDLGRALAEFRDLLLVEPSRLDDFPL